MAVLMSTKSTRFPRLRPELTAGMSENHPLIFSRRTCEFCSEDCCWTERRKVSSSLNISRTIVMRIKSSTRHSPWKSLGECGIPMVVFFNTWFCPLEGLVRTELTRQYIWCNKGRRMRSITSLELIT